MIFDQHYGELTRDITINGTVPYANSMPIDKCFLGKKFQKLLKKKNQNVSNYMNIAYEREQSFDSDLLEWELQGSIIDVVLIDYKKLFVKGRFFHVYCVGIIE